MTSNEPLLVQAVYSFKGKHNDEVSCILILIEVVLVFVLKLNIILIIAYFIKIYNFINYL